MLEKEAFESNMDFVPPKEEYCLNLDETGITAHRKAIRSKIIGGLHNTSFSLDISKMRAFALIKPYPLYLIHDHYRLIRKADVSIIGDIELPGGNPEDRIRISSNGNEALIEKLN